MANSLLTINMITREAVRLWKNSNAFIQNIEHQYDDSFAVTGAKIGDSLRIRLPNDFTVRRGPAVSVQDTTEQSTTLTVAIQSGVDVGYNSKDRTMSLDDFSERVLAPMINNLAGDVAAEVMNGSDAGIANFAANLDGSGAVITPNAETWLSAGAILDLNSAPKGRRKVIQDPLTQARTVASLAGLLNPSSKISSQFNSGMMGNDTLGYESWHSDQTVIKHTTANYSGTKTVNGAGQTGLTIVVNAITGGLNAGDIITFAGVNAVNRITKVDTGQLRQFVVTANVASGGTSISIYPAIVPPVGGQKVQYQTVTASPANSATISVVTLAASVYRKNFVFCPEAVTIATADLIMPERGVVEAARESFDGVSMRMISDYTIGTDQFITRLDVLFGYLWVRPEWAVAVGDKV